MEKPQKTNTYRQFKHYFNTHKSSAKQRGIKFELSYDQWLNIWLLSGKIDQRGKYVMCRFNDVGPYSVDNVFIDTRKNNSIFASQGKPAVWTKDQTSYAVELFFAGNSFDEIAKKLEKSYNAVRIKIYRSVDLCDWQRLRINAERK